MPNKTLIFFILTGLLASFHALAESRHIEVYSLGQHYWITQQGDTLSDIVDTLLPNNPNMHQQLMQSIVELNPDAFINNNPNSLRANKRLVLPGEYNRADSRADPATTEIESFSWGNIKRPKD